MNAKEARERASVINIANGSQYSTIVKLIKESANKGLYSTFIYEPIDDDARKKLTEDGYNVGKTSFDRNEYLTKITW